MDFSSLRTFVFDLDGVIYRGDKPQPSAVETVERLRSSGKLVFFLTNNSTQTRRQYAQKLARMSLPASPESIMTSAYATALWFKEKGFTNATAYVVGEVGIVEDLSEVGVQILESIEGEHADFVVVGLDRGFTYEKLRIAQQAILRGAKLVATNRDPTFPMENGVLWPGGGSIVAAIETAAGVESILIGKPETYSLELILSISGSSAEETIMVGDRLDTDIMVGNRAGLHTALVLGGVTSLEEAQKAEGELKPEVIIPALKKLVGG